MNLFSIMPQRLSVLVEIRWCSWSFSIESDSMDFWRRKKSRIMVILMLDYSISVLHFCGSRNTYPRYARITPGTGFVLRVSSLVAILLMWLYSETRLELHQSPYTSSRTVGKLILQMKPKHHSLAPSVYRLAFPDGIPCQISSGSMT